MDIMEKSGFDVVAVSVDGREASTIFKRDLKLRYSLGCGLTRSHMQEIGLKISGASLNPRHTACCCEEGPGYCSGSQAYAPHFSKGTRIAPFSQYESRMRHDSGATTSSSSDSGSSFCSLSSSAKLKLGEAAAPVIYCEPAHFLLNADNTINCTFNPDNLCHI
jgi:hypothetical protein